MDVEGHRKRPQSRNNHCRSRTICWIPFRDGMELRPVTYTLSTHEIIANTHSNWYTLHNIRTHRTFYAQVIVKSSYVQLMIGITHANTQHLLSYAIRISQLLTHHQTTLERSKIQHGPSQGNTQSDDSSSTIEVKRYVEQNGQTPPQGRSLRISYSIDFGQSTRNTLKKNQEREREIIEFVLFCCVLCLHTSRCRCPGNCIAVFTNKNGAFALNVCVWERERTKVLYVLWVKWGWDEAKMDQGAGVWRTTCLPKQKWSEWSCEFIDCIWIEVLRNINFDNTNSTVPFYNNVIVLCVE